MKIRTEIQKWGNGLGLRVSGAMREVPNIKVGTKVNIEIFEDGFSVKKAELDNSQLIFSEKELLSDLTVQSSHADELPDLLDDEYGF